MLASHSSTRALRQISSSLSTGIPSRIPSVTDLCLHDDGDESQQQDGSQCQQAFDQFGGRDSEAVRSEGGGGGGDVLVLMLMLRQESGALRGFLRTGRVRVRHGTCLTIRGIALRICKLSLVRRHGAKRTQCTATVRKVLRRRGERKVRRSEYIGQAGSLSGRY